MFGWIYSQLGTFLQYIAPGLFRRKGTLLLLGLDNAGKTSLMYRVKEGRMIQPSPTPLPTNESLKINNTTFNTYDLGGHKQVRRVWRDYAEAADGIFFIIDAAAQDRFWNAREELQSLLSDPDIPNIPFAILANKIDLSHAASLPEIIKYFDLHSNTDMGKLDKGYLQGQRPVELFPCSVLCQQGYGTAFKWMADYI